MVPRLSAAALVFAIIVAPIAADVCEAWCSWHAARQSNTATTSTGHHHHSTSHDNGGLAAQARPAGAHHRANRSAMIPAPRSCGHPGIVATQVREATPAHAGGVALATHTITPIPEGAPASTWLSARHGPPGPIRSTSPLRI
jgi:hypothetical protein